METLKFVSELITELGPSLAIALVLLGVGIYLTVVAIAGSFKPQTVEKLGGGQRRMLGALALVMVLAAVWLLVSGLRFKSAGRLVYVSRERNQGQLHKLLVMD